jgi:hypothetical protein
MICLFFKSHKRSFIKKEKEKKPEAMWEAEMGGSRFEASLGKS